MRFRKIALTIATSLFLVQISVAQENSVKSMSRVEIGFGGVGYGYEAKISKGITIDISGGLGGHYHVDDNTFSYVLTHAQDNISPAYYGSINPRFYYNMDERAAKGKNIKNNAANYIGIKGKYVAGFKNDPGTVLINIHWGMQRNLGNNDRWMFNGIVGMGCAAFTKTMYNGGTFYPALDAKLIYNLSKSK